MVVTMFVFVIVVVIGMLIYAQYSKNRSPKYRPSRKSFVPKTKQASVEPLVIDIADTWVKCEVQIERGTTNPMSQLLFSFFDAQGNRVYSKSYGSKVAVSYERQLSKILKTNGFELSEDSAYREWVKYIHIRTPESGS